MPPKSKVDPSTLGAFKNAAAGHEGVLSDPSGELVVKPCTAAEVSFYESIAAKHPKFAAFMPTFYGTLSLNKPEAVAAAEAAAKSSTPAADTKAAAADPSTTGTAATLSADDPGPMHGKHLSTDLSIVLENAAGGFVKPNILDLKLGARLWDDNSKPEKRARLDKVAAETTSGSLGFRIAGMRVWQGEKMSGELSEGEKNYVELDLEGRYKSYNKMYGRKFNEDNVLDGFKDYLIVPGAGITGKRTMTVVQRIASAVEDIEEILEGMESRMYSASILIVYEGDGEAFDKALEEEKKFVPNDDDEDQKVPKTVVIRLIDFAHASLVPGEGPDKNALQGVESVGSLMKTFGRDFREQLIDQGAQARGE